MDYEKRIAKIKRTELGYEAHGVFVAWLHCSYGNLEQGVGGIMLDEPEKTPEGTYPSRRVGTAGGMDFIIGILKACGVDTWEQVKGRTVYALFDPKFRPTQPVGIENLPTEPGERFIFTDAFPDLEKGA